MTLTLRFSTKISKTILALPKKINLTKTLIDGTINGLPFLEHPVNNNVLKLTKAMQKVAGELATVEILRVGDEIETRIPTVAVHPAVLAERGSPHPS